MSFKLLIDECLSPTLVAMAHAAGHLESTCVRDRGWLGVKDWVLIENVVKEDFTLVTHNSKGTSGGPGDHLQAACTMTSRYMRVSSA